MRLQFKCSKLGIAVAGVYLLLVVCVFAWLLYRSTVNPADSGEGGVLLVFFALPWLIFVPHGLLGPGTAIACILLNALILFCMFGGLRFQKRS
ncbi:MAG: SCO4225 family membrane protein [Gammaproteobacteria bacterium]